MPYFGNNMEMIDNTGLDCPLDSLVTVDINGISRGSITTIGCYEVSPVGNNISPRAFISPATSAVIGSKTPITVTVSNIGSNTVTSFKVDAIANGTSVVEIDIGKGL